jgi:hypothetical protein
MKEISNCIYDIDFLEQYVIFYEMNIVKKKKLYVDVYCSKFFYFEAYDGN